VLLRGREQLAGGGGDLLATTADLPDELTQVGQRVVEGGAQGLQMRRVAGLDVRDEVPVGGPLECSRELDDPCLERPAVLARLVAERPHGVRQRRVEPRDDRVREADQEEYG